jgi:uncharacterized protein (DUF1800 family)
MALPNRADQAAIAANRFGLGARPSELRQAAGDPRGWLKEQINARAAVLASPPLPSGAEALETIREKRQRQKRMMEAEGPDEGGSAADLRDASQFAARLYRRETAARTRHAIATPDSFVERLVLFWSNHFSVSIQKPAVKSVAGAFEREAIRPHVLGRFEEMLLASTRHPAMIFYLDNQRSVGPRSARGVHSGRGLNENLAREVMELHTVGVAAGYGQEDVTSFALALTGWTVAGIGGAGSDGGHGGFHFAPRMHEPGDRTVMGIAYPEGAGQAEAILHDLAHHPATARHLATKLVRHFVDDEPPPDAIDRIARIFRHSQGDLREVAHALVDLEAAWTAPRSKLKSPNELVVSALRGLGAEDLSGRFLINSLARLGQRPFAAPAPTGWPDTAQAWGSPGAIYQRVEWAARLGRMLAPDIRQPSLEMAAMLGDFASQKLSDAVDRAESSAQAITLLLSSPEFQRR